MSKIKRSLKPLIVLLIMMISIAMLAGCSNSADTESAASDDAAVQDTQDAGISDTTGQAVTAEDPEIDIATLGGPGGVDVDLTKLSSTMVFAVANDMMVKQNTYLGKKVRMVGLMSSYKDEESGKTYCFCQIKDAAACCAQGIEFAPTDDYSEEDYPKDGEVIIVVGTYDLYEEDGYKYCILNDAVFEEV